MVLDSDGGVRRSPTSYYSVNCLAFIVRVCLILHNIKYQIFHGHRWVSKREFNVLVLGFDLRCVC